MITRPSTSTRLDTFFPRTTRFGLRMCFGDAVLTEMEDGGPKYGTRMALNPSVDQVLQRTHAAAGNHGNGNAVSNGPGQCKIIALPRAVAIHGRHQQFARPQSGQSRRMRQRIDSGCAPTAMSKDFPMTSTNSPRIH